MKKKQDETLSLKVIVIAALCLLFLALMLAWFYATNIQFNPEKDVCTSYKTIEYCNDGTLKTLKEGCNDLRNLTTSCQEWRPKTRCEIDPEAEGCVCDEYSEETWKDFVYYYDTYRFFDYAKLLDFLKNESCHSFKVETYDGTNPMYTCIVQTIKVKTNTFRGECLSAHEANECEKGNTDYTIDHGECRLKELKDYSCNELNYAVWLGYDYVHVINGNLVGVDGYWLGEPPFTIQDVKQEMYDRNCPQIGGTQ